MGSYLHMGVRAQVVECSWGSDLGSGSGSRLIVSRGGDGMDRGSEVGAIGVKARVRIGIGGAH